MFDLPRLITRARAWLGDLFYPPAAPPWRLPGNTPPPPPISPPAVIAAVGLMLGALPKDITGARRHRGTVRARHAAALALRRIGLSYPEIARCVGWDDHSTAMSAVRHAEGREASEPAFAAAVEAGIAAARGGV